MKNIIAALKFVLFIALTFGVYSFWFAAPLMPSENAKRRLREWIFRHWALGFVRLANAKIRIVGTPPVPPFVLISNHVSYFDIAALRANATGIFVAKADIADWFLAGTMVGKMGMIFINRENRRDIPRAGAEIVRAFENGEGVIIFAEGTTSDGKQILPFKSSFLEFAAARHLPVHYASVSYQTRCGDPPASEAVCWWREESAFGTHLFDFFKLRGFDCTITFGEQPISAHNRKDLTAALQKAVNAQFVPVN